MVKLASAKSKTLSNRTFVCDEGRRWLAIERRVIQRYDKYFVADSESFPSADYLKSERRQVLSLAGFYNMFVGEVRWVVKPYPRNG
jgi:hypothetical protein